MAVNSEIKNKDLLGINAEMKELMESAEWDVADISQQFAYEDNKRTDSQTGTQWLLIGPRRGDKRIRNKTLKVTSDELISQSLIDTYLNAGCAVKLSDLDVANTWGKTDKGSTYASVNIKIVGHVEVLADEDDTAGGADSDD